MTKFRSMRRRSNDMGSLGSSFPWFTIVVGGAVTLSALMSLRMIANAQSVLALKAMGAK